jgi:hypothetical protein
MIFAVIIAELGIGRCQRNRHMQYDTREGLYWNAGGTLTLFSGAVMNLNHGNELQPFIPPEMLGECVIIVAICSVV